MTNSGEAAEQVVRLSLEGFEVAARLTGSAAKEVAILLAAVLRQGVTQSGKTRGKARLTNMIRSGKELKVFSLPQKDLKKFTQHAKRYGVLYCVLRDRNTQAPDAPVDIIARAEDAAKIQRIVDRFELGRVDKASIVSEAEREVAERAAKEREAPTKTMGERIVEEAMGKAKQKERNEQENPTAAQTEKSPLSERRSGRDGTPTEQGAAKKPSVKKKLEEYRRQAAKRKEAERTESETGKEKRETPGKPGQTVHQQPVTKKKQPKVR